MSVKYVKVVILEGTEIVRWQYKQKSRSLLTDLFAWTRRDLHSLLYLRRVEFYFIKLRARIHPAILLKKEKAHKNELFLPQVDLARNFTKLLPLRRSIAD